MKLVSSLLVVLALIFVVGCKSTETSNVATGAMGDGSSCNPAACGACPSAQKGACPSGKTTDADMGALSEQGSCPSKPGCCPDAARGCVKPCPEHAVKHPQCDPKNCDPKNCGKPAGCPRG